MSSLSLLYKLTFDAPFGLGYFSAIIVAIFGERAVQTHASVVITCQYSVMLRLATRTR